MTKTATTPWGRTAILEQVEVAQRAGEQRFASRVELLEGEKGELLVRLSYSTDGIARRGPVTLRARDLARLRTAIERSPRLAEVLGV